MPEEPEAYRQPHKREHVVSLENFHPAVRAWFERRFGIPSEPQGLGWPLIQRGKHVLVAAPTGSGKTLAAFLCAIDRLFRQASKGSLEDFTQIVYVSPLKALANDVRTNLLEPLRGIQEEHRRVGGAASEIRVLVRTGDTPPSKRRQMVKQPPHILVTTPESLFILLTSKSGREMLQKVQSLIVDEIHALAGNLRGTHLALTLERLEALTGTPIQRIGLSATQHPVEDVAAFLSGSGRRAEIVDIGHRRRMDLAVEVPGDELSAVAGNQLWEEIYDRLAALARRHSTTLIFVNTRRLAERLAHHLEERLGKDAVASHHGSLAREIRLAAESRLKKGQLKALVATASLELGIDIGNVDLVCQIGSPRSISLAFQRIGRSGHWKGAISKGRIFCTTRDELLESAALVRAMKQGELDLIRIPEGSLDVLAQQIIASAACRDWSEDELFDCLRRAFPYRRLVRSDFDSILELLAEGIATRRGRRGAYLHRDRINNRIRARRGARLAALTSGGAIPDRADYLVKEDPGEILVGTLDEDFSVESMRGDIFLLGNTSWRICRVEPGVVRVEDARGAPPTIPFWRGEAPGRTDELSRAFADLRKTLADMDEPEAIALLRTQCGLNDSGALQAARYARAGREALGAVPSGTCLVAERFFDESGGMQLVLHTPLGSRVNRAWGLALRKCFCRSFNFELQAAATENGILISLSDQHSFPLETVFSFLTSKSAQRLLEQAILGSPLFGVRWRWTAARALAVPRYSGGRKVPPPLLRMRAADLLASIFPQQAACLENIQGDIEVPDHPLVRQTMEYCLHETLDFKGLQRVLEGIESGEVQCLARDTCEPTPFSHEIVNSSAFTFLDDAPLEERRARAVQMRRGLEPAQMDSLADLDPEAIEQVAREAWPRTDNLEEVHDALLSLGLMRGDELQGVRAFLRDLSAERRVCRLLRPKSAHRVDARNLPGAPAEKDEEYWLATERAQLVQKAYPGAELEPAPSDLGLELSRVFWSKDRDLSGEEVVQELVRCHLDSTGPLTCKELAAHFSLSEGEIDQALHALEAQGEILRGSFRPSRRETEWCNRRLLSRIHRLTLDRLRREIDPVSPADFMRFLFGWHHVGEGRRLHGEEGLAAVLGQLQGFETAAASWESRVLPARIDGYEPEMLDHLCLSGQIVWGRWTHSSTSEEENTEPAGRSLRPNRLVPVTFFERRGLPLYLFFRDGNEPSRSFQGGEAEEDSRLPDRPEQCFTPVARDVLAHLRRWGASFLEDLVRATRHLPLEVEQALWELVAAGKVTADGFDSFRAIIDPRRRRATKRRPARISKRPHYQGRWSPFQVPGYLDTTPDSRSDGLRLEEYGARLEALARQLLRRWGVVFRDLLAREFLPAPWREMLDVLRRLEARGEVRGGRFVSGFLGEQFALPEALEALRAIRRRPGDGELIRISASDPLNLVGIILPGSRIRPHPETDVSFRDGCLVSPEDSGPLLALPGAPASPLKSS